MCLVIDPSIKNKVLETIKTNNYEAMIIGKTEKGNGKVIYS